MKLDKENSKKIIAVALSSVIAVTSMITLGGCSKNKNAKTKQDTAIVEMQKDSVDELSGKLSQLFPKANDEIMRDSAIILLLDEIAKEDANGKISADIISNLKSNLDSDNIISNFNAFLDILEQEIIINKNFVKISKVLPENESNDKKILNIIEDITANIMEFSENNSEQSVKDEFKRIYTLFVKEDELKINGFEFEIRDLSYGNRAVAQAYARIAAYYARNYISQEEYKAIDDRTNDQNNKAYIKETLEVLDNQIVEKSEKDVVYIFKNKYSSVSDYLNGKVNLTEQQIKDLVNYSNLKYLSSDKVSTADKNIILGEYDEDNITSLLESIDAIFEYDLKNTDSIILYSNLLDEDYKKTNSGTIDKTALDFVLVNCIRLLNTYNEDTTIYNNPYLGNVSKYFTKQNFTHVYGNGDSVEVNWQDISDSTNLVCNEIICYTLSKTQKLKNIDNYLELSQNNLNQSIQYAQNTVTGECKKVDTEYVKVK